jgi:hypothetical protein
MDINLLRSKIQEVISKVLIISNLKEGDIV